MLARNYRLKKQKDFSFVYKRGKSFGMGHFSFKVAQNSLGYSRVGVVVLNKIAKIAVARNYMRRLVNKVFADNWASVIDGYDIVVWVKTSFYKKKENYYGIFTDVLKKLKLLNNDNKK